MDKKSSDPNLAENDSTPLDVTIDSHAFVIRIWLEDMEGDNQTMLWRGQITHVLDSNNSYFQDLSGIASFISPYLKTWNPKE